MSRTLLQLRTSVRANVDEPTAGYWSDSDITGFINQAIRYVNRKTMYLIDGTPSTIDFVASQRAYSLDAACTGAERIVMMLDANNNPIRPISFGTARNNDKDFIDGETADGNTYPKYWYKVGVSIAFLPIPVASKTAGATYWFLKTPTELGEDTDASPLSTEYDDMVEWWASWKALSQHGDFNRSEQYSKLFGDMLEDVINSLAVYLSGQRVDLNKTEAWPFYRTR